ncbi:ferredoxin [Catenulispora subtropica]|uniref:Ferredoxin n=1 Tax=Catenulispora subtropica TaxID=450798 RepID=A0ABP5C3B1_9ACTN
MADPPTASRPPRATVDWTACRGHGACADLLPERITLDEWGYPIIDPDPVPDRARRRARKAVSECPALALRLRP